MTPRLSRGIAAALCAAAMAACSSSENPSASSGTPSAGASVPATNVAVEPSPSPSPVPTPFPEVTPDPTGPANIAYIRVAFYGISCQNGKGKPKNGEKLLPTGCTGYVTATPKQGNGVDVKPKDHGPNIYWMLRAGDDMVRVIDDPDQPFNKLLLGVEPGGFALCAVVRGVEGCLNGNVIR
jgi:hypothetical protein